MFADLNWNRCVPRLLTEDEMDFQLFLHQLTLLIETLCFLPIWRCQVWLALRNSGNSRRGRLDPWKKVGKLICLPSCCFPMAAPGTSTYWSILQMLYTTLKTFRVCPETSKAFFQRNWKTFLVSFSFDWLCLLVFSFLKKLFPFLQTENHNKEL